jgi:starch synthase
MQKTPHVISLLVLFFYLTLPRLGNSDNSSPSAEKFLKSWFQKAGAEDGKYDSQDPGIANSLLELKKRDPKIYLREVLKALRGKDPVLQRGALQAIDLTEMKSPDSPLIRSEELVSTLDRIHNGKLAKSDSARSHGWWLHEQLLWKLGEPEKKTTDQKTTLAKSSDSPRRVLVVTAETNGIFNTGGLGGAVLKYSQSSNETPGASKVTIVMPYYSNQDLSPEEQARIEDTGRIIEVPVQYNSNGKPKDNVRFQVHRITKGNTEVLMLRYEPKEGETNFFDNPRVEGQTKFYGPKETIGNAFGAFGKAAAELAMKDKYDVVSSADWHAGWTNVVLDQARRDGKPIPHTLLWLHNAAYKGEEYNTSQIYSYLGIDKKHYDQEEGANFFGKQSPLKGAAYASDAVTTVSAQYAGEVATPSFGYGMEWTFRELQKKGRLAGILNGIDLKEWTPKDFTDSDLSGKKRGKAELQKHFGLLQDPKIPVIAMTSRITPQKGFAFAPQALEEFLLKENAQVIIVGDADKELQETMEKLVNNPLLKQKIRWTKFSPADERRTLMYSDGFLLPSEFEPSGLNQQYALRTGAVPIVTDVGGLKETVQEGKTGFVAPVIREADGKTLSIEKTKNSVIAALKRFSDTYKNDPQKFASLRKNGMQIDSSWARRIDEYEKLYDYVQENGPEHFKGHPIGQELSAMKPSQLLELSHQIDFHQRCLLLLRKTQLGTSDSHP